MGHRQIIIDIVPPNGPSLTDAEDATCRVHVEYVPEDGQTAQQIGNEVERIVKKCEQITGGPVPS